MANGPGGAGRVVRAKAGSVMGGSSVGERFGGFDEGARPIGVPGQARDGRKGVRRKHPARTGDRG
ncbi:hypothetical protein GCM10011392_21330 [Wenxinia marina]|nr:hypothetical protein GCM10011392_21330 [Wenxinia marina]